ncbi:hypothetical protein [Roseicyclus persicicus]|uniref:Uncharacterized protein n=1 Tax=Roseicyclus persicicus TaxID=2650661 RepID=A0A7X6GZF2_9RHOB|nr:hypothetical protein [Roseibacterium persicicum]NKX45231.1 hypothetical protein [Roseibacterium persicicum]
MRCTRLVPALLACLIAPALSAQTWTETGGGVVALPAASAGVPVAGARLACIADAWRLIVPEAAGVGAVVLGIDGQVFPTVAEGDGTMAIPSAALDPLRAGSRLTLTWTVSGATAEASFGLRGSRAAIDGAAATCAAQAQAAAAPVAAPAPAAVPAEVSVTLAADPVAGQPVELSFTGPLGAQDWVGIASPGSAGSAWVAGAWSYVSSGSPARFPAPPEPGAYELRYIRGSDSAILLAVPVTVAPADPAARPTATLQPMTAPAGSVLTVALDGTPRTPGDYLYIAPAAAGDQDYSGGYVGIPASGSATITAPAAPGDWELRYVVSAGGGLYTVIGRAPLTLQ